MYYMGLDLGTNSVGWALTDEKYNIIRKKGKDIWGVRLFDEAKTASDRRTNRVSRRRRAREVARIGEVKEIFSEEIEKVDKSFFQRLDESKYHQEDKRTDGKFALFNEVGYTDVEYFQQYPTISHLRKELIESHESHDIRLVYLAILNIFKHRGHFLNATLGDVEEDDTALYADFQRLAGDEYAIFFPIEYEREQIRLLMGGKDKSKGEKAEKLAELWNINKKTDKAAYELIKMLNGLSGKLAVIFPEDLISEECRKMQLSFRDGAYEEKMAQLAEESDGQIFDLLEKAKRLHDKWLLNEIMNGQAYISFARVESYNKHKDDLIKLKRVIKKYQEDEYDNCFRSMNDVNYSGYVGSVNSNKAKQRRNRKASEESFFKYVIELLGKMPQDDENVAYLLREAKNRTLLPKQLTADNGVIPNQVHLAELKVILKNAQGYFPFLTEKDSSGYTAAERIIQLFTFQIPYYVGPLHINEGEEGNKWVVRKDRGKVYPWNLKEKVDLSKTREEFIMRMVRHCTYLSGKSCLPKNSLMYEKYMVLNQINNIKINGQKISVQEKQELYDALFFKGKKVTKKGIIKYFLSRGLITENDTDCISGIDDTISSALTSYGRFRSVIGADIDKWDYQQMAEKIIFWGTVYSGDRKLLAELIEENYGTQANKNMLTKDQIKRLAGFKWQDWGRLSQDFLELEGCDKNTGEVRTIISALWETNSNLMELLSDCYTYKDVLEERTQEYGKLLTEMKYEDLDDFYFSAPVKRMIWQTLLIMKEIEGVMGESPKKIFVEMPRTDGEKGKRTDSRKKRFTELYTKCKEEERDWQKEIENLSEGEFRIKKLYLYYLQKGICMYSGQPISLDDLFNDNLYDIDHIYPRHFVKDDSIENNLVLVKKQINAHAKADKYPLDKNIQKDCYCLWKSLLDGGFITQEKYNRLTRTWEFSNDELAAFINRQIVETGQATKAVAHLLETAMPDSEVIYVKAGNVSDFRHKNDFLKSRLVNDFHHAKDAYLNIVVGNVYYTKFTRNPINYVEEYKKAADKNAYHMDKVFNFDVERNGVLAWKAGKAGSIATVSKMMNKNTPLITRRTYEAHSGIKGGLAEQTIYSAKEAAGTGYIPIKSADDRLRDVTKYGGFSSVTGAYYFLVEHTKKKKRVRTLEVMPLYLKEQLEKDEVQLVKYCTEQLGLQEPRIILAKIRYKLLVKRNGIFLRLSGRTGNQIMVDNATPLCLGEQWENYIKHLENFDILGKKEDVKKIVSTDKNKYLYDILINKHLLGIYRNRPNALGGKLKKLRDAFGNLELSQQVKVLLEILKATQSANLAIESKELEIKAAPMKISNEVTGQEEFKFIYESVTGIYTKEVDVGTI